VKIAIVGCGWLGLPLGLSLQKGGHSIVATHRSKTGYAKISSRGFTCLQFELGAILTQEKFNPLFDSDVLILNIPVGRKTASSETFTTDMSNLLKHAVKSNIRHVIFVSTTSVYGDVDTVISEKSPTSPNTQSGKINLAVERLVQKYFTTQATILRPSGLVGEQRHPINYLAGKTELVAPNKVVNLIHQHDVIQSIKCIIEKGLWGHTLLLCAMAHPTRQDYYIWAAEKLNLVAPSFTQERGQPSGKLIDATLSLDLLGIQLKYPSPYDMCKTI
jgi:nucleoside-diphosphate-sugar epimerase